MKALEDPDLSSEQKKLLSEIQGIRQIVINICHGGFSLSDSAWQRYCERVGWDPADKNLHDHMIARDDPDLIAVVQDWGRAANGRFAELKIIQIPTGVEWTIQEYDGKEWVAEKHRTWH